MSGSAPSTTLPVPMRDPVATEGGRFSRTWTNYIANLNSTVATLAANGGVTDGSDATAGQVGEFKTVSVGSGAAHGMTTFAAIDVTSLDLAAGDWDVWGNVCFVPNSTTTCTTIAGWISPGSATVPGAIEQAGYTTIRANFVTGGQQVLSVGRVRLLATAGTTRIYLSALAGFGVSFMNVFGTMNARRQR